LSSRLTRPFGTATGPTERLAIAIAVGAMGTLGFSVTSPILPDLADELGVSRGAIGLVQAAVSIAGVLFSAMIGYYADRVGRRRVILVSLALFSICGVAGFFARSYWLLVAARFAQGIGTSGILGVGIVLIGDTFHGEERTRAMGINLTGLQLTSMMGPIIASVLAVGGTFRPFLIFVIGVPLAAWASRMPMDRPSEEVDRPTRHLKASLATMRREHTLVDYIGMLVATFVATYVLHGLGLTVTPLLLADEFDVEVVGRGLLISMFQLGSITIAIRIGRLIARHGARRLLTAGFWLMATGSALAGLAPEAWVVGCGLLIAGLGFGAFVPQVQSYAAAVGGARYRGVTVLMWVTVVRISQVLGPPTGSLVYDHSGPTVPFTIAAAVLALMAVTWIPLRRVFLPPVEPADQQVVAG
jgi:ACDE family multidrug resistance protein